MNASLDDKPFANYSPDKSAKPSNGKPNSSIEFDCISIEKVRHDQPLTQLDEEDDSFSKGYN